MTKEKIISLIKKRINEDVEEYQKELEICDKDKGYEKPSYSWHYGRIKAFREALELIGMLDNSNNK